MFLAVSARLAATDDLMDEALTTAAVRNLDIALAKTSTHTKTEYHAAEACGGYSVHLTEGQRCNLESCHFWLLLCHVCPFLNEWQFFAVIYCAIAEGVAAVIID